MTALTVVTFTRDGRRIDVAEADSPESAVVAARTMLDDATDAGRAHATASFYGEDGKLVRALVTRPDLGRSTRPTTGAA